jgi:hypothetical protein
MVVANLVYRLFGARKITQADRAINLRLTSAHGGNQMGRADRSNCAQVWPSQTKERSRAGF